MLLPLDKTKEYIPDGLNQTIGRVPHECATTQKIMKPDPEILDKRSLELIMMHSQVTVQKFLILGKGTRFPELIYV